MIERIPPREVTAELFEQWRLAVRGALNPQPMTNPVWKWLIESRLRPFAASQRFASNIAASIHPGWCFDRYGQSQTKLGDGRTVWIAGEHEDYYDSDFFIYNDVVVVSPAGEIEILGYSPETFPPTDFHSATLVDAALVLVGSLGYADARRAGITQVLTLALDHWQMTEVQTSGEGPGWIHDHRATLVDNGRAIVIAGGKVDPCDGTSLLENIDDWSLTLAGWRWERLTRRRWPRFEVHRQDRGRLHLWEMGEALWSKKVDWDDAEELERELCAELGSAPRLDILPMLYRPKIAHEELSQDAEEHRVYRILVGTVTVRYVEDDYGVQVTAEGDLPPAVLEQLRGDLIEKLEALEQSRIDWHVIGAA